jgi:hypothetical protein
VIQKPDALLTASANISLMVRTHRGQCAGLLLERIPLLAFFLCARLLGACTIVRLREREAMCQKGETGNVINGFEKELRVRGSTLLCK